jgi:hypothetical protein
MARHVFALWFSVVFWPLVARRVRAFNSRYYQPHTFSPRRLPQIVSYSRRSHLRLLRRRHLRRRHLRRPTMRSRSRSLHRPSPLTLPRSKRRCL